MKNNDAGRTIKIMYKNVEYEFNLENLVSVLKYLGDNKKIDVNDKEGIIEILKQHKIYDELFLQEISKL